jgi:hypothetical protein
MLHEPFFDAPHHRARRARKRSREMRRRALFARRENFFR